MQIKDYYKILELSPGATLQEIKQAYRRLAMEHHPDKNANDLYAATEFNEIKEAYEVLTNTGKKEKWLQDRWYNESIGRKSTQQAITPVNILKQSLELEHYVSKLDVHRMSHESLSVYIHELFNDETIEKLNAFGERAVNRQIITSILDAMKPLHYKFQLPLLNKMERLANDDTDSLARIRQYRFVRKKNFLWEKYKIILVLLATALICVLIFLTSK